MVGRTRLLLLAALLLLSSTAARAELISFYGEERVGSTGGQFLRVPAGGRAVSLGGATTATTRGPASLFVNPAALFEQRQRHGLFISHFEYAADIDIEHAAYTMRYRDWFFGVGLGMLRSGEIERTTEFHPNGTGQFFNANQFLGSVSVGRGLTDRFALAVTAKFLQENLDDYENRAVFLDLGAMYRLGLRSARIGFALRNFGADMSLNGTPPAEANVGSSWQEFPAPTVAVFGAAYSIPTFAGREIMMSLDFQHPSDEAESMVVASEIELVTGFAARGAYRSGVDHGGLSAGFGLEFDRGSLPMRLDYGVVDQGTFGTLHVLSLELFR